MPFRGQSEVIAQAAAETEQLFETHFSPLLRYLHSSIRGQTDLEDAAQDAFIKFFRARSNGQQIDRPKAWLYRVARRQALDQAKRHKPVLLDPEKWQAVEARIANPSDSPATVAARQMAELPWDMLSDMERQCLLLRADGITFREAAEVLDITISSVASYVARAIKKFQRVVVKPSETPVRRRTTALR